MAELRFFLRELAKLFLQSNISFGKNIDSMLRALDLQPTVACYLSECFRRRCGGAGSVILGDSKIAALTVKFSTSDCFKGHALTAICVSRHG
jgi:hypothetical protein